MDKFSSQEIETQYNLIKKLLSNSKKYKNALEAIKKDISYMPKELKEKLGEENIFGMLVRPDATCFRSKRWCPQWQRNL